MKRTRKELLLAAMILALGAPLSSYAMDAPGGGGANWYYSEKHHRWYYFDPDKNAHTGWLLYEGEWYWFDSDGWMEDSGYAQIDGVRYYFFSNGQMAHNQYVGLKYMDQNGQEKEEHNIRVLGREDATMEDQDIITDALYEVPRGWFARFEKEGWEFLFYKQKDYFEAPATDLGVYYVRHSVDSRYRKVKFCDADAVLQAFGEYVGYSAGLYETDDPRMQMLWGGEISLREVLEIPDYYANDEAFYFGRLFAAYLTPEEREELERISPEICEVLGDILHMHDADPSIYQKQKEQEQAARAARQKQLDELGGPGVNPSAG